MSFNEGDRKRVKILVIGGTGPTGPAIVNGLVSRGHDVTILHSGKHELDTLPDLSVVPHIHANAFDEDSFKEAISGQEYDVVFAMYGRLRSISKILEGRTDHLISIGGVPVYAGFSDPEQDVWPRGVRIPAREDSTLAGDEAAIKIRKICETEETVFQYHPTATHLRYPYIYGPNQILPMEWSLVRRALDGRRHLILADGGLSITTSAFAGNAAHSVLLCLDHADSSRGEIFNVGDDRQLDVYMTAQVVAEELGHEWEILSFPHELARPGYPLLQHHSPSHRLSDTSKIRERLNYRDLFDPVVSLRETVRWQKDNLVGNSDSIEKILQDPFDYRAEDELIDLYRKFATSCQGVRFDSEPGFGFGYYGPRENPGGARGSYRD